jgi:hypothetical protein
MRDFTKSVISYTWSSSLFGLQQMVNLLTPEGWRQNQRAADSFGKIAKATAEEMGDAARGTFRVGDDMQRRGVDIMFDVFTLGMFDGGKGQGNSSGTSSGSSATKAGSNIGEQTVSAFTQGLQAAGQTAGIIVQSMSGMVSGPGCGGSRSQPTGWGPVPPPPSSRG